MIISNHSHLFGLSHYGVVKNASFACGVSTAPEGVFKGYSIVISVFDPDSDWKDAFENGRLIPAAKAVLNPSLTKAGRAFIHKLVLEHLDMREVAEVGFPCAIGVLLNRIKEHEAIISFDVHPVISEMRDEQITAISEKAISEEAEEEATAVRPDASVEDDASQPINDHVGLAIRDGLGAQVKSGNS
jgi:hypothetical protein